MTARIKGPVFPSFRKPPVATGDAREPKHPALHGGKSWLSGDGARARQRRLSQLDRQLEKQYGQPYRDVRERVRAWALASATPPAAMRLISLAKRKADESGTDLIIAIDHVLRHARAGHLEPSSDLPLGGQVTDA